MFRLLLDRRFVAAALVLGNSMSANGQTSAAPPPPTTFTPAPVPEPKLLDPPLRIPAPGGEVVFATEGDKKQYDEGHYSFVRRAGDFLYFSGRVAGIPPGYPYNIETYKNTVRRLFKILGVELHAAGADYKDIVMIHSFHAVRNGNDGVENKTAQFNAFSEVKDEFMPPPHPAWTAVGVEAILVDGYLTEADFVAYAPQQKNRVSDSREFQRRLLRTRVRDMVRI